MIWEVAATWLLVGGWIMLSFPLGNIVCLPESEQRQNLSSQSKQPGAKVKPGRPARKFKSK